MRGRFGVILLAMWTLLALGPSALDAQELRLVEHLPDAARMRIDSILDAARHAGLPTEPIVDRALEGAAKGAPPDLIVAAVTRLAGELRGARTAFGEMASAAELTAGASALRAGATSDDLVQLRRLRPGRPLTVAAAALADLVAVGVPTDTAVAAVMVLAREAGDAEYVALRRTVGRDIARGASPTAALGVRLQALTERVSDLVDGTGITSGPRKRKP